MLIPFSLFFFGVFFAAMGSERRKQHTQTRASRVRFVPASEPERPRSRYAFALEQQERERVMYTQIQPVYFRGQRTNPPSR